MVLRMSSDHIGLEEDHSYTYKMHPMVMNVIYRTGWFLFFYIIIWNTFLLGDPGKVLYYSINNRFSIHHIGIMPLDHLVTWMFIQDMK